MASVKEIAFFFVKTEALCLQSCVVLLLVFLPFSLLVSRAGLNFLPSDYDSSPDMPSVLDLRNAMSSQQLAVSFFGPVVVCWPDRNWVLIRRSICNWVNDKVTSG
ncbi:hypothetical protein B0T20DRAFT_90104 [Sordaria brevicollis]|uniref:Uncharacterized protein n=1 Tax=Sordaria brevicollis TaxID=83679 RepID=A0AAE0NWA1_SORBR|nr:hypothetical protein B0T20DRAFT_90104 [Sordaria brevicollis]